MLQFREKHQDATAHKGLKPLVIKKLIATPHAVCRWQAHCVNISEKSMQGGSLRLTSPQSVRPLGTTPCYSDFAFSYALKNHFEIISQSNYGFCYKNYFFNLNQVFRNNYDFCESFERNSNYDFGRDYNYKNNCDYSFEKNYNFGFGKNDFGNCNFGFDFGNMIYDIGNNLKGFLFNRFNRKINSKKILFQKEKKR